MTFAEMIAANREKLGISRLEFAQRCSIPVELVSYLEEPDVCTERFINQCATALGMKITVFTGEEEPEATPAEKMAIALTNAKFPNIRKYLCSAPQCLHPDKALGLFGNEKVSMAERNLILYLSTTALYHFCDTNTSPFQFDEYLFKLHSPLFTRFEQEIARFELPEEERITQLDEARRNIFACDTMENIAIRIVEPFADELEKRIMTDLPLFTTDLELPLLWDIDDELLKIRICTSDGTVKEELKLLTVKEREKTAK